MTGLASPDGQTDSCYPHIQDQVRRLESIGGRTAVPSVEHVQSIARVKPERILWKALPSCLHCNKRGISCCIAVPVLIFDKPNFINWI